MEKGSANSGLHWFIGITIFVSLGVGGYALYEYFRVKKINETITSPNDAISIINSKLS